MEPNCPGDSLGWYLRHSTTLTLELAEHVRAGNSALNHLEGGALPEWCHLGLFNITLSQAFSWQHQLRPWTTQWISAQRAEKVSMQFFVLGLLLSNNMNIANFAQHSNIIVLCKMAYTLQPSSWTKSFEDFIYWKKRWLKAGSVRF